ncbi:MAG: phospholipase effector Tle1 domain-containing protein [Pseudomonadales bacterium]
MSGYVPNIPQAKREAELRNVEPVDIHAERWSEYERHAKQPAKPAEKAQLALRIGVFFDGTGNNAANTALGIACGAHHPIKPEDLDTSCKPYMADPDSSYGNDVTNVRKLMDLYAEGAEPEGEGQRKQLSKKLYIDGIGTNPGGEDSRFGLGMGRGDTGVRGRAQQAFVLINKTVKRVIQEHPECEIGSLTFDVFGFSRGAAAARHFANEVVRSTQGNLRATLQDNFKSFSQGFDDRFQRSVTMGFIGLFDTVASVGGLANLGNIRSSITPWLNLYLSPKHFTNVFHLVARDEVRANFPVSTVQPDQTEIILPGAHSDIGGGYLDNAEECILISPMQALVVARGTDVITTSIYRDAEQAKQRLIAEGWPASMLAIVTPAAQLLPVDPSDRMAPLQQRVYAALQLKRRVSGGLSNVYLRVMYERAKSAGVHFNEIDIHDPMYSVPAELQALSSRFSNGDYSVSADDEKRLKNRYIHVSAHWNNPLGKRTHSGANLVYINAPNPDGIRRTHPHAPEWTLQ